MSWMQDVYDFLEEMEIPASDGPPKLPTKAQAKLFVDMIQEEVDELKRALEAGDMEGIVDAAVDIPYSCLNVPAVLGIDIDPFWDIVHASNMAKAGGPRRDDGKQLKPKGWSPPDIAGELKRQGWKAPEER